MDEVGGCQSCHHPPPPAHYFHLSDHPSSEGHLHRLIISSRIPSSHMADTFIPSSLLYHGCVHYWRGFPPEEINQRKHESQCKHPYNAVPTSESEFSMSLYLTLLRVTWAQTTLQPSACRSSPPRLCCQEKFYFLKNNSDFSHTSPRISCGL